MSTRILCLRFHLMSWMWRSRSKWQRRLSVLHLVILWHFGRREFTSHDGITSQVSIQPDRGYAVVHKHMVRCWPFLWGAIHDAKNLRKCDITSRR